MAKTKRAESRARYFTREVSQKKGWNVCHPDKGGDILEEQEIVSYFPGIGLGTKRPDFLFTFNGEPKLIIETKNNFKKFQNAIDEAVEYADIINANGKYTIKIAIGIAGDVESGYIVKNKVLQRWNMVTHNIKRVRANSHSIKKRMCNHIGC